MNYFTYDQLLTIHDKVLSVSGGLVGIKDEGLLRGPTEFIRDDDYYPTFSDKLSRITACQKISSKF